MTIYIRNVIALQIIRGFNVPWFNLPERVKRSHSRINEILFLGRELGLGPGDFLLDGDHAPPPQKGAEPPQQFSAQFYCGQTAGCFKMPLGMDVGLSSGDFVLDGDPALSHKRGANFRPMFIAAKRLDE